MQGIGRLIRYFDSRCRQFRRFGQVNRVLELGCGRCDNLMMLHRIYPQAHYYGVDLDETVQRPDWVHFQRADLENAKLEFPNDYFDLILFTHVIEHLKDPYALGSELHRLLAPGGRCYVEAPNWTSLLVPSFGFKREQGHIFNFFDDRTHIKPWSRHGLFTYLRTDCRLESIRVGGVRNGVRLGLDPMIMLASWMMGNRAYMASSVWNLFGWAIWGMGTKAVSTSPGDKD